MTNSKNSPLSESKTPVGPDTTSQPGADKKTEKQAPKLDPTRYGDWEKAAVASTSKNFQCLNLNAV